MKKTLLTTLLLLCLFGVARAQGSAVYDFEDGLVPAAFTNDATYPWEVATDAAAGFSGTYCLKTSNAGVASSESAIELTVDFSAAGTISFKALCMGEGSSTAWDKCVFEIDGVAQFTYGANVSGWNDYSYEVAAGSHTFKWYYSKDSSVNPTGDYMAIDDVTVNIDGELNPNAPTNVAVSEITDNSAKVTWDGTNDRFTLRYRPVAGDVIFSDSFEDGLGNWVTIDADGDGYCWDLGSVVMAGYVIPAHEGEDCATSQSYDSSGGALNPDNYLVTADKVALGGMLTFWACAQDASYPAEHFGVAVSTAGNTDAADFTMLDEWTMTAAPGYIPNKNLLGKSPKSPQRASGTWYQYTVNLSAYAGQEGYVAIRHFGCTDQFYLDIDEVEITAPAATAPNMAARSKHVISMPRNGRIASWQEVTTTENFAELTGLDANTNYEVQVQGVAGVLTSEWSPIVQFTTAAAVPPVIVNAPTDLTVSDITATSATVSWNGDADGYEMELGVAGSAEEPAVYDFSDGTLQGWTNIQVNTDGGLWLHSDNNPGAYDYSAFMDNGFAMCYSFIDYDGAYDTDAYLVSPQAFDIVAGSQLTFKANQANVSYPESFSVCVAETTGTPTAADFTVVATPTVSTGYDDTPTEISVDLSAYAGKSIWIAFHDQNYDAYEIWIDDIAISGAKKRTITWTPVGDVTSPYNLTGLDPETEYNVRVRGVSGSTTSDWVATTFTTLAASTVPAPTDLAISDITATSAVATWTGSNDTYTLRYRPVEDPVVPPVPGDGDTFSVDFESGMPDGWTVIDGNEDGYTWCLTSDIPTTWTYYSSLTLDWYHNGTNAICSGSYINGVGALTPDEYLVSPQVNIANGSTFSFYAAACDDSYPYEHFGVYVSDNGTSDWTKVQEWTLTAAPGYEPGPRGADRVPKAPQRVANWYQYSVDLSAYEGQKFIAIRHFDCNDEYVMCVDDIELSNGATAPQMAKRKHVISMLRGEAEWTTLDVAETTAELTGLEPETTYEVQVQGITGGEVSEWTDVVTFTTLAAPAVEVPTDLAISEITSESAVATWSGTTDTYNIRYREVTASTDAVTVTLTTDDVWGDGSGYQMLLDADATAYGTLIPESGPMTTGGDVDASVYAEFEYKIPEEADGSLTTTNMVNGASATIQIPAGTYDYVITNPTPGDRMWIASAQGSAGGRQDDYTFEAGKVYEFHVYESGSYDATDVTITDARGAAEWTTVEDVTSPYSLTGLTAETEYEVQVQGVTGGVASDWTASVLFTTTEATGINGLKIAGQENWYTIDGRKLAKRPTTAGVYILNGSKVIIK